jgi:phosphoserine phosphatase
MIRRHTLREPTGRDVSQEIRLLRQRVSALRKLLTDNLDAIDQELSILDDQETPEAAQKRKNWKGFISSYKSPSRAGGV